MRRIVRNHINYGELVKVTIEGIPALVNRHNAEAMRWDFDGDSEIGDFITLLKVELDVGQHGRTCSFYLMSNDDIAPFAAKLSAIALRDVKVESCARILARYRAGSLVGAKKTLRDFYSNISDEEMELTRF